MELELLRYSSGADSTMGLLFDATGPRKFLCYTIEDEYRKNKVAGETRIPEGKYDIKLRTEGGFHNRYKDKFGNDFHKGMLWLQDVPNFEYILIHIGNTDDDTAGCILVGDTAESNVTNDGFIGSSTAAYKRIYPDIVAAIEAGEKVFIRVTAWA